MLFFFSAAAIWPESHPVIDDRLIYATALAGIAAVGVGRFLGFGRKGRRLRWSTAIRFCADKTCRSTHPHTYRDVSQAHARVLSRSSREREKEALIDETYPLFLEDGRQLAPSFWSQTRWERPPADVVSVREQIDRESRRVPKSTTCFVSIGLGGTR